jgi:CBS domain-containing protein
VEHDWIHPVGVFSEPDLVTAVVADGKGALALIVGGLMSAPIISYSPTDAVDAARVA